MSRHLAARAGAALPSADAAALRNAVRGAVVLRGDAGYDDARRIQNAAAEGRPAAVVQVSGISDIAAALRFARRRGLSVSVRSGGHGVTGHAVGGDLVFDLRALCGVRVDPARQTVTVGGGTTCAALDAATCGHGMALPSSRVGSTGVAGLVLGGGLGWLSAAHGLTADSLLAAEIVTADGTVVAATAEAEPDLFWSLCGGGAPGVVTSLTFRLHRLPSRVVAGLLLYPIADLADVLSALAESQGRGTGVFTSAAMLLAAPPRSFVPGDVVGRPVVAVIPACFSDDDSARPLTPLRDGLRPLADTVAPMSYLDLQSLLPELGVHLGPQLWSASVVPALDEAVVTDLDDAASELARTRRQVLIAPTPVTDSTAAAVPTYPASWLVHSVAAWRKPREGVHASAWQSALTARLNQHGALGAWPDLDSDAERRRMSFGDDRYERLRAVRASWDPDGVFTHSLPISPAPAGRT